MLTHLVFLVIREGSLPSRDNEDNEDGSIEAVVYAGTVLGGSSAQHPMRKRLSKNSQTEPRA